MTLDGEVLTVVDRFFCLIHCGSEDGSSPVEGSTRVFDALVAYTGPKQL